MRAGGYARPRFPAPAVRDAGWLRAGPAGHWLCGHAGGMARGVIGLWQGMTDGAVALTAGR